MSSNKRGVWSSEPRTSNGASAIGDAATIGTNGEIRQDGVPDSRADRENRDELLVVPQ